MVADLSEKYVTTPNLFQFIQDISTDWAVTNVIHDEIGD